MQEFPALFAFNRGLVSPLGLARTDQKRVGLSAAIMENWIPRVLGSMSLRPGLQYIGATGSSAAAHFIPFVFATDDTALVEFTDLVMRVWIDDVVLTRVSVATTITNGTFTGNITGWTDNSDSGGAISWETGNYMNLTGNGTARAIGYQQLTVAAADATKEHGLTIIIARGPVTFKVGTSIDQDDLFSESVLDTGSHSLAFTPPAGSVFIQFSSTKAYKVLVQNCTITSAGAVSITSPFTDDDLSNIRYDQSADTVFLACTGLQQRKIERRGTRPGARSWSLSLYQADDGPFETQNFTPTTLTASATTGDITLTASSSLFSTDDVGRIFRISSPGGGTGASIAAQNTFTTSMTVGGSGNDRSITITLNGTWTATVTLQVSTDNSVWADVAGYVWTANVTGPYIDGLDGQLRYYRIGVKTGEYTSGTVSARLAFTSGRLVWVARATAFVSSTVLSAQVVSVIGGTTATNVWEAGAWSEGTGYPTSLRIQEGRLWWAGQNGVDGSISDSYFSYDDHVLGDAGPIQRTIGSGPVDIINWIMGLQRIILGAQGAEFSIKSSSFDTPLTPTDFSIKSISTQGSTAVDSLHIDQRGIFVDRSATRVFEVVFDIQSYEYSSNDLTAIVPELGVPGIVRVAVQRKPDTRIHCVRSDGTVMMAVIDKVEDVLAWINITSGGADGLIEDVVVLPGAVGSTEDQVYYVVNRTINGTEARYLEKWAAETECRGTYSDNAALNKQADAFLIYSGSATTTITGLSHLEGEEVIVWGDGVDYSPGVGAAQTTYTVASGSITLGTSVSEAVVGLPYNAPWQSSKLGIQASLAQSTLNQHKRINNLGLVAAWLHAKGIQFGPDFDNMDDLPSIEQGAPVVTNTTREMYDEEPMLFPGIWNPDARLCIQANAPRPATILAMVPDFDMNP